MIPLESYPASSWRPNQRDGAELICAAASSGQTLRIGLEAPCGSGKSLMALRAAFSGHCPPCNILSTTRAHLRQYEETLVALFPQLQDKVGGWAILRGRSFYSCCGSAEARKRGAAAAQAAGALGADSDPAEEWIGSRKCPRGEGCYYRQAILKAGNAAVVLQCTIGFLYRRRYWNELPEGQGEGAAAELDSARRATVNRDLIILDEAHEYLRVRREFELERLAFWPELCTEGFRAKLAAARQKGNYKCGYVLLEPGAPLRYDAEAELLRLLKPENLEKMRPSRKLSDLEWAEMREKFAEKLRMRLALVQVDEAEEWQPVVSLQFNDFASRGSPSCELVSEPLFAQVKESLARCEVFMSATLAPVARMLKIEPGCLRSYPEIFDWAEAVTVNPLNDPDPDSRANRALGPEQLEALYNVPGRPLTLVLFMSKAHANAAVKGWGMHFNCRRMKSGPSLLIQSAESELSDLIEEARVWQSAAKENREEIAPMLVTYGGWVGADLPGEKWLVIGSAPKSPVQPHHEARQIRGFTRSAWDDGEKASLDRTQLAQGLGRALRSNTDTATLIWIDSQAFRDLGLDATTGRIQD
jgi:hypothetical protein